MDNFSKMKFFSARSSRDLGEAIAKNLGIGMGSISISDFKCGETYACIDETIRGLDVYLLQTIGAKPNDDYMELFVIMDALKRSSASKIHVILPHFGYARQDKKTAPREPISARLIADLLSAVGFDRLITIDLHSDQIQGFFQQPVDHLTALPLFAEYLASKKIPDLVVVAPDTGRAKLAKKLSDRLGGTLAVMHKTRAAHNQAEITNLVGSVKGKNVVLMDDIIDTAGSIVSCISRLRDEGCLAIYVTVTHPVLSDNAIERLRKLNITEFICSDTIPLSTRLDNMKVISTAPLLADVIKRNYKNESISSLFLQ